MVDGRNSRRCRLQCKTGKRDPSPFFLFPFQSNSIHISSTVVSSTTSFLASPETSALFFSATNDSLTFFIRALAICKIKALREFFSLGFVVSVYMEDPPDTSDVPKDDSASVRVSQLSSATDTGIGFFVTIFPSLVERSGRWGLFLLLIS
jgi:hypothetical protein